MKHLLLFFMALTLSIGAIAQKIPFQGKLTENGVPVTGARDITFTISTLGWTEAHTGVQVTDGLYALVLGTNNPLPADPFKGVELLSLGITVNSVVLTPVNIYAPPPSYGMPREVTIDDSSGLLPQDTVYHLKMNSDNIAIGQRTEISGNGTKYGEYIKINSEAADGGAKYGQYTEVVGAGTGWVEAIRGQANTQGSFSVGVSGFNNGPGNGTGGSTNLGVFGSSSGNPGENRGVEGRASGSVGVNNYGVWGHSIVSNPSAVNKGVYAVADGVGALQNFGIYAQALNGTENWAGWFDGSTKIVADASTLPTEPGGQAALDLRVTGTGPGWWDYGIRVEGSATGNNLGIGSTVTTTADNTGMMHLGIVGNANGDATGLRYGVEGNVNGTAATQSAGVRGKTSLAIPDGSNSFGGLFQSAATSVGTNSTAAAVRAEATGAAARNIGVWGHAANGTQENWAGWFDGDVMVTGSLNATMASNNVNDPNGVTVISMNAVEDNGANPGLWAGEIYLNGPSTPNFQIGAPTWEGNNGPERARMTLFGTTPDGGGWYKGMMALSVDSDGTNEWGTLGINGANSTNFNFGAKSWEGSSDRAFMHMFGTHDAQGPIANFEVNQGGSPGIESAYINLQTQDGTNNYGIVQIGASGTNSESGGMWLRGANTGDKVSLRVDDDGAGAYWGQFDLMGPNSPNFTFGGKNWEGSADYPFMHMFGNHSGLGPAGIFELGQDGTGAEWGSITLQAQDGTNNYGTVNINTVHDTGGADPSGFSGSLSLDGNTSANVQLGSKSWENHNLGIISVHGATGSVVEIQANFDGINETGQIAVGKSTGAGRTWVDPHQLSMHGINDRPTVYLRGERFGSLSLLGEKDDGGTWVNSNIEMNVFEEGTKNVAAVQLFNTESGGLRNMTVGISSNFANQGVGAIELFDNIGTQAIIMEAGSGNVTANGSMFAVAFNTTSDARLKKNITTIDNSLSNVLKMRGVSYKWKDENMGTNNQIGLIAQEVEEVYPEFVHTKKDGYKSVNYAQMTAVLIEAVKELNKKIEALEEENSELRASLEEKEGQDEKIDSLQTQVQHIMQLISGQSNVENNISSEE